MAEDDIRFFPTPRSWRQWLEKNHDRSQEQWVGFHKKGSGKPSITWPESVDQALCFGWIDGLRKNIDEDSYKIRYTPRKLGSIWSKVNIDRVKALVELALMQPAGLRAFQARSDDRSAIYAYEQRHAGQLEPAHEEILKANRKAWDFFQSQPPSYRKTAIWWVISAKQEATRLRRLATLIDDSAHGRTIAQFTRRTK